MDIEEILAAAGEIIRIPSVKGAPLPGKPFGKGPAEALAAFLRIADGMGFETVNYDNYCGEVIFGSGEREMGILCHLDVVPAGDGWTYPPFEATRVGDRIYGRGTDDDKIPAVVSLFAMKALKDEGFVPKCRIKLILGCDEESGWGCIEHYRKVARMPDFGFSPDSGFPVVYAEKGILHLRFAFPCRLKRFSSLVGGDRANMVPARASARGKAVGPLPEGFTEENGEIVAHGVSAHGSSPELGVNAIRLLLDYLASVGEDVAAPLALFGAEKKFAALRDETGALTFSPNLLSYEDGTLFLTADVRYPATRAREDVLDICRTLGSFTVVNEQAPLFLDKNCPLIRTLLGAYEEVTGEKAEPGAIGGGTYARALPVGVAFGPAADADVAHQPNEYTTIPCIVLTYKVLLLAIRRLTEL